MTNPDPAVEMRRRVAHTFEDNPEQRALLQAMDALATELAFAAVADLWAPALYNRNAFFFEPFLLHHLDATAHRATIADLMERCERDGFATLFAGLYRKVTEQASWDADMATLAASPLPDDAVLRALHWRDLPDKRVVLGDDAAVALYRRNPAEFGPFVLSHVRPGHDWQADAERTYPRLRLAAKNQGDDPMIWSLFRLFASQEEWDGEMALLQNDPEAPRDIVEALEKRHPAHDDNIDPTALLPLMDRYGTAMIPYLDRHLTWLTEIDRDALLAAAERLGDAGFTRRIFFLNATPAKWRERVTAMIQSDLPVADLAAQLAFWQPPTAVRGRRGWWLPSDVVLTLYQRDPARFGAWVARTVYNPSPELFDAVAAGGDDEMLATLTHAHLEQLSTVAATGHSMQATLTMSGLTQKQRDAVMPTAAGVIAWFDRLAGVSPARYAHYASRIMGQGIGRAWRMRQDDPAMNPVAYLAQRHLTAWLQSGDPIREVLEAKDRAVVEFALELLAGEEAAPRVVENMLMLRALLLMRGMFPFKRAVLHVLEQAAAHDTATAQAIAPALEEAMWYRGENAINERVMISYVRVRRLTTPDLATV